MKYKCTHCGLVFSDKNDEGILSFRGKLYCKNCEEPVVEIPDQPQTSSPILGAQTTLISNSDNRIITNNYYGGGTPDEKVETLYGPCRKNEARLCKQCRQWIPLAYFNQEKCICYDCELKESHESFEEGKNFFEMGFYDEAINCFQKYESTCSKEDQAEVKTMLGRCYYEQKDYKQALKYFIVASRNNAESLYYLGICYLNGNGIANDTGKALELIQKSADFGNQKAMGLLKEKEQIEEQKKEIENIDLFLIKIKGYYGFIDIHGNIVIPCQWEEASDSNEGIVMVKDLYENWGLIDRTGNMVSQCQWNFISHFKEGLAVIQDQSDRYGYIDKYGNIISLCQWKHAYDFSEGFAAVCDENENWGFIDKTGRKVISCHWWLVKPFSEGFAAVCDENKKWGFIDKTGNNVIPCQWENVYRFSEGFAGVCDENKKWGFIDKTGNNVIPCHWDSVEAFTSDLIKVKDYNDKWGLIDKTGKVVAPCQWEWLGDYSETEGLACVGHDGKYGWIDGVGNNVIPCKWKSVWHFSEGLVRVQDQSDKYGFLDKTGNIVIPCKWKEAYDFSEGLTWVRDFNRRDFFIDKTGKNVISCHWYLVNSFSEGFAAVCDGNKKWGFIDKTGTLVIPCEWNGSPFELFFHKGLVKVYDDDYHDTYININGTKVAP